MHHPTFDADAASILFNLPDYRVVSATPATGDQPRRVVIETIAASGMGCAATRVIRSEEELAQVLSAWYAEPAQGHLMVESHQAGEEFHIDAVWSDGEPLLFAVSRYAVPVVEVKVPGRDNSSYVVRRADDPELYRELEWAHEGINAALGISSGITHTEVFRRAGSPTVVSEVATRFAGSVIPEVVGYAVGRSVRDCFVETIRGVRTPSEGRHRAAGTVGWTTLSPLRAGRLNNVEATCAALQSHPAVLEIRAVKRDGDFLDPWLNPSQANVVDIVVEAASPDAFRRTIVALAEDFPITVKE